MAFVALYGFETSITAPTAANAGLIQIDNNVASMLALTLGAGNYSYAALSDGLNYEIVKITSITAPFLSVTRAQDGTTSSAFPIGSCIRFIWNQEGIAAIASGTPLNLVGTGITTATFTGPNTWTINTPVPVINGTLPIEVLGSYPLWDVEFAATNSGCCCNCSGSGTGGNVTLTGTGAAFVTGVSPVYNIDVPIPVLIGTGTVTVTGTYPNYTINGTGGGGSGVNSVTGSAKILIGGTMINPVVQLLPTGVSAGYYNGITLDSYGTVTTINPLYIPLVNVISTTPDPLTVNIIGDVVELAVNSATQTTEGVVKLAAPTSAGSNNTTDFTSAVTPGGINAVLAAALPNPTVFQSSTSYTPAPSASYTNPLAGTTITFTLTGTQTALVTATASATDSATTSPPSFGLAVFQSVALVQGIQAIYTGNHILQFVLTAPFSGSLSLKTTALTGTTSIVSQSLTAVVLP